MTSQKGLSVNVVGREVMVDTEGFYEYAAAPGILGSEVSDLLESRFYGPQSLLWIEDADLPKVEEVSGHLEGGSIVHVELAGKSTLEKSASECAQVGIEVLV